MKCPLCQVNHKKFPSKCESEVINRYAHIVIVSVRDGVAISDEERTLVAKKHYDPAWVDETMKLYAQMKEYLKKFE